MNPNEISGIAEKLERRGIANNDDDDLKAGILLRVLVDMIMDKKYDAAQRLAKRATGHRRLH
jgi:hypothetical protein